MYKTQLVQKDIGTPDAATQIFSSTSPRQVPVVLVPAGRWWCSCYYTVPSGVSCITQRFGKDCDPVVSGSHGEGRKMADPGLQCSPACYQIAYCVTKQACTYEAPVKSCPTIDNVMIDCELTLVFNIGPEAYKVRKFIYKLGAIRFNEFLAACTDEAMRQLVRGELLENVLELRGSNQGGVRRVLETLNLKFKPFGVSFSRAVIKEVRLGSQLEQLMEKTTNFRTKIKDIEKEHEVEMRKIDYDYQQRRAELDRDYDRRLQDIENDMNVALIDRSKLKVTALSKKEVSITKAEEQRGVALQKADADLNVVTLQAQQQNEDLISRVQADTEAEKIKVKRDCEVKIEESRQLIEVAEMQAQALTTEANAEGQAAAQLKTVREWKLQMAKLEVEEAMARKSRIMISGENGDRLLGSMLDKSILGDIKLVK